jgi:hypothetical protein
MNETPRGGLHDPRRGRGEPDPEQAPVDVADTVDRALADPYWALREVLAEAYDQAAYGKGAERHARGNPFHEQHMQTISRLLGTERGMAFQAVKKLTEGLDMVDPAAREREILGAINYLAGIVVYFRQQEG